MDGEWLAERFGADRTRLQAVAYRVLGSARGGDEAREGGSGGGARGEEPLALDGEFIPDAADPECEAMLGESVGLAMLAVLQRLAPAERVAFVLHDVFGVSFEEIAGIVGRSPVAARQLASRGR